MRVYFAGPLFNEAERAFNLALTHRIEQLGYEVFLPQRDGVEADRAPYDRLTPDERRAAMFARDRDEVLACDVFLFVTGGRVPDEGAAVELGIASAHRRSTGTDRLLVGLRTDVRTAFATAGCNPLISQALDVLCGSTDELVAALTEHLSEGRGDPTLAFQRSLPAKRMGAGSLLRDEDGRVLMVEPTYKPNWEIPGGAVDADESPRECAIREVREELGVEATPGRLLVIDYQHPEPGRTESIMFVFDGGVIDAAWTERIELNTAELHRWRFVTPDEQSTLASPRLCRRIHRALTATRQDETLYLENGQLHP